MAIQMRRGEKKDFKPEKLKIGEFAVPTDTGEVYIKTSESTTKGIATLDPSGKLEQMPTHSDVGAAEKGHKHSAADITSGTLPIARGGTGANEIYTAQSNLGLLKRYPDFSHLTLPETLRDVRDIFRLMENNSYIETTVGSKVSSKIQAICPVASGCLKIVRFYNQYTGYAEFYSNPISENSKWVGSLHNDRGFVWNKVYTSNCIIPIENGGTGATTADKALTNLKLYTTVGDLGLSYPCTTVDIVKAMPTNSEVKISVNKRGGSITDLPIDYCLLTIRYSELTRYQIFCTNMTSTGSDGTYIGNYVRNTSISWEKIFTDSQVLSIENGGTGASTQGEALANLGTIPVYTSISNFISYPCTTSELVVALPYPSILILNVDSRSTSITDLPCSYGILTVHKRTSNRIQIIYNRSYEGQVNGNNLYFGNYNTLSKTVTWNKIFTNYSGCQVPIENGGTGATTADEALENLGAVPRTRTINSKDLSSDIELNCADIGAATAEHKHSSGDITSGTLPIARGGTGGTDTYTAQSNLGLMKRYTNLNHLTLGESYTIKDIFLAMKNNSYIEMWVGSNSSDAIRAACPVNAGTLRIYRLANQYEGYAEFNGSPIVGNVRWFSSIHADRLFVWNKVYTSNQTVPIKSGGTGATTASAALSNLGAVPATRTINSKPLDSNIELNCADIGAAEENHAHDFSELANTPTTLAGYGITDVLSNEHTHDFNCITEKPTTLDGYGITDATPYEAKSGADFNEMKTPGLYTMRGSTANAPTSGSYHSLIVNKSDNGDYVQQIAIKESSYEVYMRYLNGSSWSAWKQISMADHVQSIDKGGTGATTASAAILNLHGVEATTSAITYYISPSGSNSNSGKSSSSPFKTLAHALSKLPKFLKHDVTINVAQGTYSESEVLITGFVGEGSLSIVGTAAANAVGAENYIFSNGIKINKNQGRVELHGIGSSSGFRVFNSPNVVFYYCHAYSPSLVADRAGFFSTHSKVFTVYCRATNIQNGFHSYQGGDLTAMCGVCTNCSYPWCSGEGAVLYVYGASSSGFTSAYNYSSAGILVGPYGGMLGM